MVALLARLRERFSFTARTPECSWAGKHSTVQAVAIVQITRECGHSAFRSSPICNLHLMGLHSTGGRSGASAPCESCGIWSRGIVSKVEDLDN